MTETDRRRLHAFAALDAAGALTNVERAELLSLAARAPEATRRQLAAFYESATALTLDLAVETPSPSVRDRILAHAATHQV